MVGVLVEGSSCLLLLQEGADNSWRGIGGHWGSVGVGGVGGHWSGVGGCTVHRGSVGWRSSSVGRVGSGHSGSRVGGDWSSCCIGVGRSSVCWGSGEGGSSGIGGHGSGQETGLGNGHAQSKADEELQEMARN